MHEILTLQLGQRANYACTHYWNTQESYHTFPSSPASPVDHTIPSPVDHDIHFRQGIGADGSETYLPRTLIYDLKGGFGSLRRVNELYEIEGGGGMGEGRGVWNTKPTLHTLPPITPSPYLTSLSSPTPSTSTSTLTPSTVRYWSDFTHTYFHPRSIIQLNDYTLHSSLLPFESYSAGDELFESLDKEHDLLDRDLRLWAEECDQMQGVQVFTGADDAWGGFCARYMERVRDEFGKCGIWVWGLEEGGSAGVQRDKQLLRTTNTARSLHDISAQASIYIPITAPPLTLPPSISLNRSSQWHTSALLATAIESMTLPTRMRNDNYKRRTLNDLEAAINVNGNQRIARLQCSILDPDELVRQRGTELRAAQKDQRVPTAGRDNGLIGEDGILTGDAGVGDLDIDFFPGEGHAISSYGRKAAKAAHVFGQIDSFRGNVDKPNRDENGEDEGYARKRRRIAGLPMFERFHTPLPYSLLPTFPCIFPSFISPDSLAVHASLSSTTQVAVQVKALQKIVMRMVGFEEREALGNGLGEIAEAYEEGWDSGSDSDGDD